MNAVVLWLATWTHGVVMQHVVMQHVGAGAAMRDNWHAARRQEKERFELIAAVLGLPASAAAAQPEGDPADARLCWRPRV